ncbi:MAG: 4-hydroxy-tetrahydrodipicolinate synthase [Candidatus Gastranaerophilales bacterium]|nr:4-hydroxy-tetrahydrodipicolinate synthase [Candidatus Gastranaerophilales bacterium]
MAMRYDAGEIITAMVTPFDDNMNIDYSALERLLEHLIENGTDAVLVAATTGESPTLTHEEELEMLAFVKEKVDGRIKIIMSTGSNSTATAVTMSKKVEAVGADALLSVVPYYNKPSQAGIYEHFKAVAEATNLPIIMYNIPGRTGINMQPETVAKLANDFTNIVALKQSNSNLDLISEMKRLCPSDFVIYSGDDSLTLPMMSIGVHGVVSVTSHIVGKQVKSMIKSFKEGDIKVATEKHLKLYPLFTKLFMAPNPVPVKEALSKMGIIKNKVRLPLVTLNEAERADFYSVLDNYLPCCK